MSRSAWCRKVGLIVVLFTVSVPIEAYAQSAASISGVVKDTAGSVLPGVTVQQDLERRHQRHEQRRALLLAQASQLAR